MQNEFFKNIYKFVLCVKFSFLTRYNVNYKKESSPVIKITTIIV